MKRSIQVGLGLLLLVAAAWFGYDMVDRGGRGLLWGYRPLGLFLSAYAAAVFLIGPWLSRDPRKFRWLGYALLSGGLLSLGFPDIGLPVPILMFVGFVPLLLLEREIAASRPAVRGGTLFRYAYLAFVLWNILTTYWVANSALVAGLFAVMANAAVMCIPFLLFHHTRRVLPGLGYAAFAAYWLSFEYLHFNWELTWPWLALGHSFAEFPALVQWYAYTGVFGGSLWVLVANVLSLHLVLRYRSGAAIGGRWWRLAALLLLPVALSLLQFYAYDDSGQPEAEVVVVQPDYEPHYEKFTISEAEQVERFLELAARELRPQTDYLVFPETSFGYMATQRVRAYPAIRRIEAFLEDFPQTRLVTGLNAYYVFGPDEPRSPAARRQIGARGDTLYLEILNAAAQLAAADPEVQWYRKSKLVPGPEIFPYRRLLWFLGPLVEGLQGTWEGVGTQPERSVFRGPRARVGPVICYESVFGEYYGGYVRAGAQAMFIMTNDGWWDNTAGHRQHLHFASLRAIETRRSIARSANTGISAFIDQRGIIRKATPYEEAAVIRDTIRLNDAITFYVAWGDVIARLAAFAAVILLLNLVARSLMPGPKPSAKKGKEPPAG